MFVWCNQYKQYEIAEHIKAFCPFATPADPGCGIGKEHRKSVIRPLTNSTLLSHAAKDVAIKRPWKTSLW